jgi:hypothetical protein
MSDLTSSPYFYTFDNLVVVIASATNSNGNGAYSDVNTSGARIRSVPDSMSTPTITSSSDT